MPPKGGRGGKGKGYNSGETFSGQKKKAQLQSKREKRRQKDRESDSESDDDKEKHTASEAAKDKLMIVTSFGGNCSTEAARLSSMFIREDDESVAVRRARGADPLAERTRLVAEKYISYESNAISTLGASVNLVQGLKLCHPVRPRWTDQMTATALFKQEEDYFQQWCRDISRHIQDFESPGVAVAPFELNLEVWRQLWRVIEQSDVVVLIVDVRNPTFHISPSLVHDVVVAQKRSLVIVLSKCDLVSQSFVQNWRSYLSSQLPDVSVVEFMSRPAEDPPGGERGAGGVSARRRWLSRRCRQSDIDDHLSHMAKKIVGASLQAMSIGAKDAPSNSIGTSQMGDAEDDDNHNEEADGEEADGSKLKADDLKERLDSGHENNHEKGHAETFCYVGRGPNGALAIGLVGHPNVGKTSVLNALAGHKAAGVSGTAGHTKHLQHIRVNETVHFDAFVIDCPGLVFPSLNTRAEAELNGLLPIAQVRETLSAVRLIAEAISLPKALALKMPEWYDDDAQWTPQAILEASAEKHKYYLPRSGAPDVHRAGLEILRDAKDGAILLAYDPPS